MFRPEGRPRVMGILNVTPDSFSDGGNFLVTGDAVAHGRRMLAEGADLVDVGGESTRPGAAPVEEAEELRRVIPVIEQLAPEGAVSVDTTKPEVARRAVEAGASLLNDVSGGLWEVAAGLGVAWVAMHRRGTPADMQELAVYDDVRTEVFGHVLTLAGRARAAGVGEVWVDPGIGFAKTADHNLTLLAHLDELAAAATAEGWGVLVGTSRKSFLGRLGAFPGADPLPVESRLAPSLATVVWCAVRGASMVRVHDVRETVQALTLLGPPRDLPPSPAPAGAAS